MHRRCRNRHPRCLDSSFLRNDERSRMGLRIDRRDAAVQRTWGMVSNRIYFRSAIHDIYYHRPVLARWRAQAVRDTQTSRTGMGRLSTNQKREGIQIAERCQKLNMRPSNARRLACQSSKDRPSIISRHSPSSAKLGVAEKSARSSPVLLFSVAVIEPASISNMTNFDSLTPPTSLSRVTMTFPRALVLMWKFTARLA
jgi:hypothetical protein